MEARGQARVERRLAAILAADVAGYSRLMEADEEGTLAALRAIRRELGDPKIAEHRGRIVKTTGDGLLVEFASVVDAVRCAAELQRAMVARNADIPPAKRIEFRVGVHLGDVVEEGDGDLMGDGVNIAARLEGIAEPGAICLSEDAYRQVKARLDVGSRPPLAKITAKYGMTSAPTTGIAVSQPRWFTNMRMAAAKQTVLMPIMIR